ncbi:deoxyguanosinetriphosphate triphosphohydrolase, putative [Halobacteroides halobius DSM 5150]|uniref:Deoxyguanosinetriphosphate triphosphohydrolase, putative n=1 Tax=Halobacteroides halobius (strain ATCC 35273 / DSM 5150 / MD-1) TaxID=748449 RepID=L0K8C4_HALHC|nr:dNTP triphosphohydrolase [Halobacteroides halobius]AGB40358.1 deoxyguanosinetriphosphate triphosphohydrolase, putative [Halobacteroides halobius DSM 5150]
MESKIRLQEKVKHYKEELNNEALAERFHGPMDRRARNPFQRDYARILYSSSFRRLQGKRQLLGVRDDKFFRNRLTHSLEVAQISRAIAERLGYKKEEIYVVESCALAHDIGISPFGHYGEEILNELSQGIGGFEGNAQNLRVLMNLEKKRPDEKGLNLTYRTLLGVVKYFKKYDGQTKKFIYDQNYDQLKEILTKYDLTQRTLDVQIMDLADEIAYAAHDLEDTLSMKLFNIDEVLYEFQIKYGRESIAYQKLTKAVKQAREVAKQGEIYNSSEEYNFLFNKELTSNLVNELICDLDLVKVNKKHKQKTGTEHKYELGFKKLANLAQGLKDITFECINRTDLIKKYEKLGEKVIRGLYKVFSDQDFNADSRFLPVEFRAKDVKKRKRLIIDYIAGMMDKYAISTYEKFYGAGSLDGIYE